MNHNTVRGSPRHRDLVARMDDLVFQIECICQRDYETGGAGRVELQRALENAKSLRAELDNTSSSELRIAECFSAAVYILRVVSELYSLLSCLSSRWSSYATRANHKTTTNSKRNLAGYACGTAECFTSISIAGGEPPSNSWAAAA